MNRYQIISMHESTDGVRSANVLMTENSPFRLEMRSAEHPHTVLTKYFTTVQQAEDAAEDYVLYA